MFFRTSLLMAFWCLLILWWSEQTPPPCPTLIFCTKSDGPCVLYLIDSPWWWWQWCKTRSDLRNLPIWNAGHPKSHKELCTALAEFAKPHQDIRGIFVKPFHLFWGADLVAKQKDPFTCANMILFLSSKQFPLPFMGGVRTKKNWTSKLCYAQSPRYFLCEWGFHLCLSVVPSWRTFGTKDLDLCRTLLENIPPDT